MIGILEGNRAESGCSETTHLPKEGSSLQGRSYLIRNPDKVRKSIMQSLERRTFQGEGTTPGKGTDVE